MGSFLFYLAERDTSLLKTAKPTKDSFADSAPEAEEKKKGQNYWLGAAYEAGTAMILHEKSGAAKNKDPEQQKRYRAAVKLHQEAMSHFGSGQQIEIYNSAKKSAEAYLNSLEQNHGIKRQDIKEVHHTYAGIDKVLGKKVDQQSNPHDVAVVTKTGKIHGASLKYKSGTLTNNTVGSADKMSSDLGIQTNFKDIWEKHKKAAGLSGLSEKDIRIKRADPNDKTGRTINSETQKHYKAAQNESAKHHTDSFNKATPQQRKLYLQRLMKTNPAVGYDYVLGDKGTSEPIENKKHTQLVNNAKDFHAETGVNGRVNIYDNNGNHIMHFEHRSAHGAFLSNQVNGKYGTGKPKKPTSTDRKSTRLNSSHTDISRMPSSA